jgi:hypothetical protein
VRCFTFEPTRSDAKNDSFRGSFVAREDAIWDVNIDGKQHGPLSRTRILAYLHDGRLVGSDLIWRPGFSDWKPVSELAE